MDNERYQIIFQWPGVHCLFELPLIYFFGIDYQLFWLLLKFFTFSSLKQTLALRILLNFLYKYFGINLHNVIAVLLIIRRYLTAFVVFIYFVE